MATWAGVHPQIAYAGQLLLQLGQQYDPNLKLTSGYRSFEKQQQLYNRYLRGEHAYPVAPPGRSMHNHGRAFDLYSSNPQLLAALGRLWQSWGGTWGGSFSGPQYDPIHFQV